MKKYYKEYEIIPKSLKNGKVKKDIEYTGQYYSSHQDKAELYKYKLICLILIIVNFGVLIGLGFLKTSVSRIFYITIPYICLFLPAFYCLIGAIRLVTSSDKMEHVTYDRSLNRIVKSVTGQIFLCCVTIIGTIYFFAADKNLEGKQSNIIFFLGVVTVFILNVIIFFVRRKIVYKVEKL
ncbi:MAG: hypothetical protein QM644_05925 [Mobilitalea sp.]